jgi:hypothetical protein
MSYYIAQTRSKMFESVILIVYKSNFHLEIYQNNIYFYFLKFIGNINKLK